MPNVEEERRHKNLSSRSERITPRFMTWETYLRLTGQVDRAEKARVEAGIQIGETGEGGDWHENAPFEKAHEDFGLYTVMKELHRRRLEGVEIVEPRMETDSVDSGNTVIVHWDDETNVGKNEVYTILFQDDSGTRAGWISGLSPLGKSLMGKRAGERFSYAVKEKRYGGKIIKILPGDFEGKPKNLSQDKKE